MTSPAQHTVSAAAVTWESFALTDSRWLVHALLWSLGLLSTMVILPWLVTGFSVIFGLAVLAAVVTAYTDRREPTALSPATLIRYLLVDGFFVGFAALPIFSPIQFVLAAVGLTPRAAGPFSGPVLLFPFVCVFYLCLGGINHARLGPSRLQAMPPVAAATTAALLIIAGYSQYSAYRAVQQERRAGVSAYEQETGHTTTDLAKLQIGNSLHGFDARVASITNDRQGRLLVSGGFEYYAGKDARGLVRLLPDGQKDTTFSPLQLGAPAASAPSRVLVLPDESIVINIAVNGSGAAPIGLTRLRPDGTVDPQFRPDMSMAPTDQAPLESMDVQFDGRLVIASPGRFVQKTDDACLLRFDRSGGRDAAFSAAAMEALYGPASSRTQGLACSISKITALATGHLLVEGSFLPTGWKYGLVRLHPDGSLDAAYHPELDEAAPSLSFVTPGGEVFLVSYVPVPGSSPVAYQARCIKLKADGGRDTSFTIPAGRFLRIERLAVQPDGRIVVTGTLGEKDYGAVVRLLPDGRPDPTFAVPAGAVHVDGFITTIGLQSDGRIVLGGEFQQVSGPSKEQRADHQNIARLLPDGTLDASFIPR